MEDVTQTQPQVEETESQETVEESSESTSSPEATNATDAVEMFKMKYNHEDIEVSMDEARALAQKGKNYDKVQEKLSALESSPQMKFVESQAKKNNMSIEDYLGAVAQQEVTSEIAAIAEKEEVSVDIAKKLYDGIKLKKENEVNVQSAKAKKLEDDHINEFVKLHPDVKEISTDVWVKYNEGGISLVDAYNNLTKDSRISSLETELAALREQSGIQTKNTENSESATGSVTGNGETENLFSREQVKNMSRDEVKKNFEKVTKSMKSWK